jgi:hypothetical protein
LEQITLQLTGHARAVASDVRRRADRLLKDSGPKALADVVLREAEGRLSVPIEGTVRCVQKPRPPRARPLRTPAPPGGRARPGEGCTERGLNRGLDGCSSYFVSVSSAFFASPNKSLTWRTVSSCASAGLLTVPAQEVRPGSRLGYRVPLRGAITDVTPPTGGRQRMSSKRSKNPALPTLDDAFRLASVKDAEESTRDLAARLATAELRRVSHPGRVTWEPTDQVEPVPVPPTVVDGDGDLWLRDRGTGTWTMPEFNPKEFPARCGEVLTWNELAREFGPLTALADDRRIGGGRRR